MYPTCLVNVLFCVNSFSLYQYMLPFNLGVHSSVLKEVHENNEVTYLTNEDFGIAAQLRGRTLKALNGLDNVVNVQKLLELCVF